MKTAIKLILFSLLLFGISVEALDWTARLELRDSSTAPPNCQPACSTSSTTQLGGGVTSTIYLMTPEWGLFTGALLRQRGLSFTGGAGPAATVTYLDFDVPLAIQWAAGSFAARFGVDLAAKLSSTYSVGTLANNESDKGLITPVEVALDWKFTQNQLVNIAFESGVGVATGIGLASPGNLATANIITLGYGYLF